MIKKHSARFVVNLVILLALVACDVPSNRNTSQNNIDRKMNPPPATILETGPAKPTSALSAKVFGLPEPNHYQVNLSWSPLAPSPGEWVLQRESANSGLKHLKTLESAVLSYEDAAVAAGESYRYFLVSGEAIEADVRENISVSIPFDLAISGRAAYQQINGVERLFLPAGAVLFPKGDQLFIDVKTIIASGGLIESNGRAITIKAQRATGNLKIRNLGEDGREGAAGGQGSNGSPGSTGAPAELVYSGPRYPTLDYQMLVKHMTASLQNDPQNPEFRSHFKCQSPPGPGGNGGPGSAGATGQDGGAGGDSGRLYLAISSTSGFELDHISTAGRGGDGGTGGTGGAGGLGGRAGARDASQICPEARPGQNGPAGAKGMKGKTGPDGHLQPYCLKLGDGAIGNCAAFGPTDFINGGTIR